jgi:GNAT superfamily N-acetyltransferase
MIKKIKLSKFNGMAFDNLYATLRYITKDDFKEVIDLFFRVIDSMENKNWLKFRDELYLQRVIDNGGFIVGCFVDDKLIACALCETPDFDYTLDLIEMGLTKSQIDSTFVSGYVMVDPMYRGNSLHRVLLETRIDIAIKKNMTHIITAVACDNLFSLRTILGQGFDIKFQKQNKLGITRNILLKDLLEETSEITA